MRSKYVKLCEMLPGYSKRLFTAFIIKVSKDRRRKQVMKFNLTIGSSGQHIYEVNDHKYFRINFQRETHEIKDVSLVTINEYGDREYQVFKAEGLLYLENVCHGEDNEVLDTNLLYIAEKCFTEKAEEYEA